MIGFGTHPEAEAQLLESAFDSEGSTLQAAILGQRARWRLRTPGRHWAMNTLAVLAAVRALSDDLDPAAAALGDFMPLPGRGERVDLVWRGGPLTLIDESYNASPAAMRAALSVLGATPLAAGGRRVAVLGDMLELGNAAAALHRDLAAPIEAAKIDRVFLVGTMMEALDAALPQSRRGGLWPTPEAVIPALLDFLEPGDVVTVKGSRSVGTGRIVDGLRAAATRPEA